MTTPIQPNSKQWKDIAEHLARGRKERVLRANPMLDEVAVKLNRQPTWDEKRFVEQFLTDLNDIGLDISIRPVGEAV